MKTNVAILRYDSYTNLSRDRAGSCGLRGCQIDLHLGGSHTAQEVAVIGCNHPFTIC